MNLQISHFGRPASIAALEAVDPVAPVAGAGFDADMAQFLGTPDDEDGEIDRDDPNENANEPS